MDLSIIIPVYNVEKYILECLESVYHDNTLSNFEVLCIDDCGKDKSIELIKEYIKENNISNLKIIEHKKNAGLSAARNTGLVNAKGKYVYFIDSDDMINAKSLKLILLSSLEKDLDIAEGKYVEIFETKENIHTENIPNKLIKEEVIYSGDDFFDLLMKYNYLPMVWQRIYKREFLVKNNLKFCEGLKFEDEEFSPRAIICAKRIMHFDYELYLYRRRDESITTSMVKNNDWVNHYIVIINNLLEFAKQNKNQLSYHALINRIGQLSLSLYKNPIMYGSSKENIKEIVDIVKMNKIYLNPIKSTKISIKLQGIIMKYPKLFFKLYSFVNRGVIK